jgi:hypothetical protein
MQGFKKWMVGAFVVAALSGTALLITTASSSTVVAREQAPGDHWRNFDGHWSYWHEGDHRWYYTDGVHWYFYNGTGWAIYAFDKLFGAVGFHVGDYHPPAPHAHIEPPHHGVFGVR